MIKWIYCEEVDELNDLVEILSKIYVYDRTKKKICFIYKENIISICKTVKLFGTIVTKMFDEIGKGTVGRGQAL